MDNRQSRPAVQENFGRQPGKATHNHRWDLETFSIGSRLRIRFAAEKTVRHWIRALKAMKNSVAKGGEKI